MESYLYQDLYDLEEHHWWHISKRKSVNTFILKYIHRKNLKILDIGCGAGRNIEELKKYGSVWGLDNSEDALRFCKKRGRKNLIKANSENSGLKNKSFDLITLLDVLEHTDDKKSLKEIYRILKPSGYLLITVPAYKALWSKWDEVLHHKRRYTKQNLTKILDENGFSVAKVSYLYSFLYIPAFIVRSIKKLIYKNSYPSDFKLSSPLVNKMLIALSDFERKIIMNSTIPFGTSIICLAQKI